MTDTRFAIYDRETKELVSYEEYQANREKLQKGDPTARSLAFIDKRVIVTENNRIIGTRLLSETEEWKKARKKAQAETPASPEVATQEETEHLAPIIQFPSPTFIPIEPENTTPLNPEYEAMVQDPDLFVRLVNRYQQGNRPSPSPISRDDEPVFPFSKANIEDDNLFINVTERHRRLKDLRAQAEKLAPDYLIDQIISEFKESSDELDSYPEVELEGTLDDADPYTSVYRKSVSKGPKHLKRTYKRKFVEPSDLVAIALSLGIAVASIGYTTQAISKSDFVQNIQDSMQMKSIMDTLNENDAIFNNILPNKVIIPYKFDNYHNPLFWLDTDAVARGILNEGDNRYIAALYYAYYEMKESDSMNECQQLDNIIASVARMVDENTHPIAFSTTSHCLSLEQFLIKNGLVNEDGTPSIEKFETFGKDALRAYSEAIALGEEAPNFGGRV